MKSLKFATVATATIFIATVGFGQQNDAFVGAHGATMPETYLGVVGDQQWHLDIWPDQAFHLIRMTEDGADADASAGRWHADGRSLYLATDDDVVMLQVQNAGRLRPVRSPEDASGDLVGQGGLDPASISLPMAGMFTYFADAATFVHCATGRMYPVAQEGDYLAAETAYLADRSGPAEPLFVTLDGTIDQRPQMEGPEKTTVIIGSFKASWSGEDCARAAAAPDLEGTVWQISHIGQEALDWTPPAREPFLVLDEEDARFNASVGCNTVMGGYTASDDSLSFGAPASTMMACPDDLAEREAGLIAALQETSGYLIGGRTLRLVDPSGALLAAFEAVYLP